MEFWGVTLSFGILVGVYGLGANFTLWGLGVGGLGVSEASTFGRFWTLGASTFRPP